MANNSIERLGLAQWHAASLPFEALVRSCHMQLTSAHMSTPYILKAGPA